jgi:hypothetical protein
MRTVFLDYVCSSNKSRVREPSNGERECQRQEYEMINVEYKNVAEAAATSLEARASGRESML